jgi:hypothetical protein
LQLNETIFSNLDWRNPIINWLKCKNLYASNHNKVQNSDENDDQDEEAERHLTNHSARRCILQKLDDTGVEHNHIKQVKN